MKPYGIISDTHHHNWSQFSHVNAKGVNNRLQFILDETWRCASKVVEAGGDTIYHAGDLFHVRGSVAPSVMNPTRECYRDISKRLGLKFVLIPGNHDMEHKKSNSVGNAIEAVAGEDIWITSEAGETGDDVMVVPWIENIDDLRKTIEKVPHQERVFTDLIIHAPIDGVLAGIPPHGITPGYLASLCFKRVFAGHYHHHKDFGNNVYSIGALCQHTFGDANALAGFLIVSAGDVKQYEAKTPKFVNLNPSDTDTENSIAEQVKGNYVKFKTKKGKVSEVNAIRAFLEKAGALGVVIDSIKEPVNVRPATSTMTSGASLEVSIGEFIKEMMPGPNVDLIQREAIKILSETV